MGQQSGPLGPHSTRARLSCSVLPRASAHAVRDPNACRPCVSGRSSISNACRPDACVPPAQVDGVRAASRRTTTSASPERSQ
eukprot:5141188-Alexandrium_andersonii.AAC.1